MVVVFVIICFVAAAVNSAGTWSDSHKSVTVATSQHISITYLKFRACSPRYHQLLPLLLAAACSVMHHST